MPLLPAEQNWAEVFPMLLYIRPLDGTLVSVIVSQGLPVFHLPCFLV